MSNTIRYLAHGANKTFQLIAEPRIVRLIQFAVYLTMIVAGTFILIAPPWSLRDILGSPLVAVLGSFVLFGAAMGAFAVLPGVWWLERVGILSLATGLAMYFVVISSLGAPLVGFLVGVAFIVSLAQRWMEIRRFQLAPKKG